MNLSKYDENATATIFRTLSDLPIFNEKSLKSLLNFNTPEEIAFTGKVIKQFENYTVYGFFIESVSKKLSQCIFRVKFQGYDQGFDSQKFPVGT